MGDSQTQTSSLSHIAPFIPTVLENSLLRLEIYPELGGKIGSLRLCENNEELLQPPLKPYSPLHRGMSFEQGDAGGIDECLPSVSPCQISAPNGPRAIPDHGDFWHLPFSATQHPNRIELEAVGYSLPIKFQRTIELKGSSVEFTYTITNLGTHTIPYLWSAHPSLHAEPGDRIVLPSSISHLLIEDSAQQLLGKAGERVSFPSATLKDGTQHDLALVLGSETKIGDKLFAPAPLEHWAALDRNRIHYRITIRFDQFASHLGIWRCYGSWPENSANRQQCVALEPCTAPMDSLALAIDKGYARTLEPTKTATWKISLHLSKI